MSPFELKILKIPVSRCWKKVPFDYGQTSLKHLQLSLKSNRWMPVSNFFFFKLSLCRHYRNETWGATKTHQTEQIQFTAGQVNANFSTVCGRAAPVNQPKDFLVFFFPVGALIFTPVDWLPKDSTPSISGLQSLLYSRPSFGILFFPSLGWSEWQQEQYLYRNLFHITRRFNELRAIKQRNHLDGIKEQRCDWWIDQAYLLPSLPLW